jgi:hypothetical protein
VVAPSPWGGTAGTKFDVVFVLPIRPDTPAAGGEIVHRRIMDGLVEGGYRVGVVTRSDLGSGRKSRFATLLSLKQFTTRLVIDSWRYRVRHRGLQLSRNSSDVVRDVETAVLSAA